jgi:UDP-N-acetyl-D-glucosamine dehydrogenase
LSHALPIRHTLKPVKGTLLDKIRTRKARVGVIGLGYVGLPLVVEFAKAGLETVGFDINTDKVKQIARGESYISDVSPEEVRAVTRSGHLTATTDFSLLATTDTVNICVPTPLRKTKDPDLSYVVSAVDEIAKYLHPGQLIILESTTYPGTVDEVVQPKLEANGLRAGTDFFLAFSPERVDPGNAEWTTRNIPKVVGGIDETSTRLAAALYEQIVETVVPVSSTRVAEMVKLLENTFRAVNIGLVNELALMCRDLNIDVWEVIDAAKTKPFGFMSFYPGPGLGGHCIPIDPFYLSWKARQTGFESRLIEVAGHVNAGMPRHVVDRVAEALNSRSRAIRDSRVHLLGVAYKSNVGDVRESPALDIVQLLQRQGAVVGYSDPFVPSVCQGMLDLKAVPVEQALAEGIDCAVITTHHRGVNYAAIVERALVVVDTRNVLKGVDADNIFRL